MVKPFQLEIYQRNAQALTQAKTPTKKTQIWSFLGFCNVYQRFPENFTEVDHPPLPTSCWRTGLQRFSLETRIHLTPLLTTFSRSPFSFSHQNLRYSLYSEDSACEVRRALFRTHPDGKRKQTGFWSRTFFTTYMNYSSSEREFVAVFCTLKTLRPYLLYERFRVHTGHASLHWLFTIDDPSGLLMRWFLRFATYDLSPIEKG